MGRGKKIIDTSIVVDKALELIQDQGYEEFSTRKLAAELHISAMTLYNYFQNREAILKEAVVKGMNLFFEDLPAKMEETRREGGNPLRIFKTVARHLVEVGTAKPKLYLFLFNADLADLRKESRILLKYRAAFDLVAQALPDPERREELHRAIYLYEVLANALVLNVLRGRSGMTIERFEADMALAYARLIEPYEAYCLG